MLPPPAHVTINGMSEAAAAPLAEPRPPRKLYRSSDGRWLGGVARGLAGHLGLPVIWVRLVFVGLFMADGLGALLYAAFWFFVPLGVGAGALGTLFVAHRSALIAATSLVLIVLGAMHALGFGIDLARILPGADRAQQASLRGAGLPRTFLLGAVG